MARSPVGIWLIGVKGGVASTAIVGLAALNRQGLGTAGLVSELPAFGGVDFAAWPDFVVGGHEIRRVPLPEEATKLITDSRTVDHQLLDSLQHELEAVDRRIRPGTLRRTGPTIAGLADMDIPDDPTPRHTVERLKADLAEFAESEGLGHVVVVNVASTEPTVDGNTVPRHWKDMEPLLEKPNECPLPASSLYAIAALESGCSLIDFTPSLGGSPAAFEELLYARGTRHMGYDGKTGETLMKSVLAPMFARRNLEVMSWVGHNIFGNLDSRVLDQPENKKAKVTSKDRLLGEILGYRPQTLVSIENIESLGDWKTAWDHIHFRGFLDTPMTLQFIWQGCDSVLAAPLVLDLVRFTELAGRRGHVGRMPFLASFFKSPLGVEEQRFDRQYQMLEEWAAGQTQPPVTDNSRQHTCGANVADNSRQ